MNRDSLLYIAGFVDGEGCISLYKTTTSHSCKKYTYYYEGLVITNTNREVIQWIRDSVGYGCVYECKHPVGNRKIKYEYKISQDRAVDLIKQLLPFLIVKKQQALKILEHREIRGEAKHGYRNKMPHETRQKLLSMVPEFRKMNARGKIDLAA
jgi:hypothetical protein